MHQTGQQLPEFGNYFCKMSKDITLQALRLFIDVATQGSFSDVARRRGLPTSSVSRHINALETRLGHKLLVRNTRAVRLTDAGTRYVHEVREILAALDIASDAVRGNATTPQGRLHINAPVAFGRHHIAPHLAEFQHRFPGIEVDLTLTDAFIDPISEGADVVIRIGTLRDSSLVSRKLAAQRYVAVSAASYLEQHGAPPTPDALADHNCLVYKGANGEMPWLFRKGNEPFRPYRVKGSLRSNDADSLITAARQGQGIILFPTWLLHEHIRQKHLLPILTDWQAEAYTINDAIHLLFPENRMRSPKVTVFLDFLSEATGKPPYWDRLALS